MAAAMRSQLERCVGSARGLTRASAALETDAPQVGMAAARAWFGGWRGL